MADVKLRPHYKTVDGIRIPAMFSEKCAREAMQYAPKPDDVFIATYPKCGTTWMQNIALYIFRKGRELEDHRQYPMMCPFIDALGQESIDKMPRPGAFKTHLPYDRMPHSPESKYIYVLRNPKDCCVSLYYHAKHICGFGYWDATFDDFFELFMAGEVEYNDYFDHLESWEGHRGDKQVFFTTYEAMKKDTQDIVLRLSQFLGREYIEAIEQDSSVLRNILHFSGFEYMKKHISELYDHTKVTDETLDNPDVLEGVKSMVLYTRSLNPPDDIKLEFVRKGEIGDWKGHLSTEQSSRLNEKFLERTKGTEIYDLYKDII